MSFILDAIRKSEDERQRGKGPDVYSMQPGAAQRGQPAPAWARALMLLLALALLAFITVWLWPRLQQQFGQLTQPAGQPAVQGTAPGSQPVSASPPPRAGELQQAAANAASANATTSADSATALPASADAGFASDDVLPPRHLIKELWELPADYQSTVPDLKFSFHVYSRNPDKRTIIINGRRLREGQMITSQMRLRVITETGVICHHRGRFFHVDVVEKW